MIHTSLVVFRQGLSPRVSGLPLNDGGTFKFLDWGGASLPGDDSIAPPWEDCWRVFTTSRGHVTMAPTVPATLKIIQSESVSN